MALQIGQRQGGVFQDGANISIPGERAKGQDVRTQNVVAVNAVANVVKSSLGPQGLDKMLVDDIGDVMITNDGASILQTIEVEHPAAKVLVEVSGLQDKEVGDGTTSVVLIAAELLKRANELVREKIHPTNIIVGYRLAVHEAVKYIKEKIAVNIEDLGEECLMNIAKTTLGSKLIGAESEYFSRLVVDAIMKTKRISRKGKAKYSVKSVRILKSHGKSSGESQLIDGFALNCTRASLQMPTVVNDAKIALIDFALHKSRMQMGVELNITDPDNLPKAREEEMTIMKKRISTILSSGANVIFTTKGIDDACMKLLVEESVLGVRRITREDMNKIARITDGVIQNIMPSDENNNSTEVFTDDMLGYAKQVIQERVSDDELIYVRGGGRSDKKKQEERGGACSIVLRGANEYMLDEMERSVHDALCTVKRALESGQVVPGGGAVEAALSIYLENFATTLGSREQLAIAEFAQALLVIPKTLSVNAAQDATELVARLRAFHNAAQTDPSKKHLQSIGLDLLEGTTRDNLKAGVIEPLLNKVKALQFATEAAITILRIDDVIKITPPEEMQQQQQQMMQ